MNVCYSSFLAFPHPQFLHSLENRPLWLHRYWYLSISMLYFLCPSKQMNVTKHHEILVYPVGISPLQYRPWPLRLSLTKRVTMSVWHTKQQIVWHSALLFSILFSFSHSRFLQRRRRVSGSATVSSVKDWSQIKVGQWKERDPHPKS